MSIESKFTLPVQPTTSHYTLPPFFSQLSGAINSSHSLPASPSRPPHGFTATSINFFPMPAVHSRASDDLDLLKSQRKVCETIREVQEESEEDGVAPPEKRACLDDGAHGVVPIQGITSINARPRVQFAQPNPLQFLPISLGTPSSHLGAPLSSFLPQSYFNRGQVPPPPVAATNPHGNQTLATDARNNGTAHSNSNEG